MRPRLKSTPAGTHRSGKKMVWRPPPPKRPPEHKLQKFVFAGLAVLFLVLCTTVAAVVFAPEKHQVRVFISGSSEIKFKGEYHTDGVVHPLGGSTPQELNFETQSFDLTVKREGGHGELTVLVFLDSHQKSSTSTAKIAGGIEVEMKNGYFQKGYRARDYEFKK